MAVLSVAIVLVVGSTLRRPAVPTFRLTDLVPEESGDALVGPRVITVDASDPDRWIYFDLSRGTVVERGRGAEWDLAFRRSEILVNGGEGFPGEAGVVDLGEVLFEEVDTVPANGYVGTVAARDSVHPLLSDWYDYSFTSHLLRPKPRVWAVRTADGRYAKLRFLSYYCPGPTPGCLTFEYVYQGSGERQLPMPPHRP